MILYVNIKRGVIMIKKITLMTCLFLLIAMGPALPEKTSGGPISPLNTDKVINSKAPDFTLKDLAGKNVSLSSFRGKVVLLNFWATWCPPCRDEMPSFNKLYHELNKRGLEIIAVSTDGSVSGVKSFVEKIKVDFPVLSDADRTISKQYRVFSMPTTFLIDKTGKIVDKFYGEYDWTEPETKGKIEKLF